MEEEDKESKNYSQSDNSSSFSMDLYNENYSRMQNFFSDDSWNKILSISQILEEYHKYNYGIDENEVPYEDIFHQGNELEKAVNNALEMLDKCFNPLFNMPGWDNMPDGSIYNLIYESKGLCERLYKSYKNTLENALDWAKSAQHIGKNRKVSVEKKVKIGSYINNIIMETAIRDDIIEEFKTLNEKVET